MVVGEFYCCLRRRGGHTNTVWVMSHEQVFSALPAKFNFFHYHQSLLAVMNEG